MTVASADPPGKRDAPGAQVPGDPVTARPPGSEPSVSDEDLRSAFDNAPIGIAVMNPNGVITGCNAALSRLLDQPAGDLIGGTFFDVTHPDDLAGARHNCRLTQDGRTRILRHECRFSRRDGSIVWVMLSTSSVPAVPDRAAHLIMHIEDISERKALEAELLHQALHDPLTGLGNRTMLAERISHAQAADGDRPRPHCLLYIDLDGFKNVNDRYGHSVGDEILKQLAARMAALLRPEDTAARVGGDEFAVLCVNTEPRHADVIAERLVAAAAEPFTVEGHTVHLSATVGVSTSDLAGAGFPVEAADLVRRADLRMYETKRQRRSGP
jgi:diguanylate cyclase (GGDEF)-like protein/PAS domain S-box-containing protein